MIWRYIWDSIVYVVSDNFFLASMAVTVMIGLFIGAVIYDGCLKEIKKLIISMFAYIFIIISVTTERLLPNIYDGVFRVHRPFAGIVTILSVTIFYLLGMFLGVLVTKHAHKNKEE